MELWIPDRVYFEPSAREYPAGERIYQYCVDKDIPVLTTTSHNQVKGIPGETEKEKFANAKKTLVVGTKKSMKFEVCKPSAHYQFSLMTNCPGNCEYCYLFTTQGKKPYVRVYVNLQDTFTNIDRYIEERLPHATMFEAASTGDPLAVEHITGTLNETVEHFGKLEKGRLRIVTKYSNVENLLNAQHNGHTRFRFTVNSEFITKNFEHNTDSLSDRLLAAEMVAKAGYPIGFIIAPIIRHENWEEGYRELFQKLHQIETLRRKSHITFELIQHRFTLNAKTTILERYPNTKLDMDEEKRVKKYGKYGRMKYIYKKDEAEEIRIFITSEIKKYFPKGQIQYFT